MSYRPGQYAKTSTGSFTSFTASFSTSVKPETKAKPRIKSTVPILYPLFNQCAAEVQDPFWVNVFQRAATGKFPRKFNYREGFLHCKIGSRMYNIEVPENPYEAVHTCLEFFQKYGGLLSDQDLEKTKEKELIHAEKCRDRNLNTWSKIPKKIREIMIENYLLKLEEDLGLTSNDERISLRNLVNIGCLLGYYNKDTIILENDAIREINGVVFDSKTRKFSIDESLIPKISKTCKKEENTKKTFSLVQEWCKLMESLDRSKKDKLQIINRNSDMYSDENINDSFALTINSDQIDNSGN